MYQLALFVDLNIVVYFIPSRNFSLYFLPCMYLPVIFNASF